MAEDLNMMKFQKFVADELKKMLQQDKRFENLTPEKLTSIVQKAVETLFRGKIDIRAQAGAGGREGGGRIQLQIEQVLKLASETEQFIKELETLMNKIKDFSQGTKEEKEKKENESLEEASKNLKESAKELKEASKKTSEEKKETVRDKEKVGIEPKVEERPRSPQAIESLIKTELERVIAPLMGSTPEQVEKFTKQVSQDIVTGAPTKQEDGFPAQKQFTTEIIKLLNNLSNIAMGEPRELLETSTSGMTIGSKELPLTKEDIQPWLEKAFPTLAKEDILKIVEYVFREKIQPVDLKQEVKKGAPKPVTSEDIQKMAVDFPDKAKDFQELLKVKEEWETRKEAIYPGDKATRAKMEKGIGIRYTAAAKKVGLIRVKGNLFWEDEWKEAEKALKESEPKEQKSVGKKKLESGVVISDAKEIAEKQLSKTPSYVGTPVEEIKKDMRESIKSIFRGQISDEEILKIIEEVFSSVARTYENKAGEQKEVSNLEYYTEAEKIKATATQLTEKIPLTEGATTEQIESQIREELDKAFPEISLTNEEYKRIIREVAETKMYGMGGAQKSTDTSQYKDAVVREIEQQLGMKTINSLTPEKMENMVMRRLTVAFEGVPREELLKIYREVLEGKIEKTPTGEKTDFQREKDAVARKKADTKDESAERTVDPEATKKLKEKVRQIFNKIGEELHKVIPDTAVDAVMQTIDKGSFNELNYLKTGGPGLGYGPIKQLVDESGLNIQKQRIIDLKTGKTGDEVTNRQLETARKILDFEIKRETVTRTIYKNYKVAAQELDKYDPRFLQDPQRKLKVLTETSTGSNIIKASFTDDLGVVKQATVVIDKYGDVVKTTLNRHASFFQGVARDVREFAKWSVAIALVYTPMQKLKELIDLSIKSQTLLADTIVTLGETQEATNKIFESAAKIAQETGESILGVIEGYNLALRASGDVTDQLERYKVANQLLTDSITLAKLSTLSQAEATDILVAALKQTGTPLDQGQKLLDKWVRVTKVANVDLTTLATSFSIVGEAASKAGLDIDQLNGLIALMASQTGLSAKETGNAIRALISGYTSDPATKELANFGIAVKKLDGDAREFEDVMYDIRTAFEEGLITPGQLNKIANAIGGGIRRQAQVVTSIVNMNTMNQVAAQSAEAHGDAQQALAIEMDTVSTKATLLSNSFTKLAQTLGMEGGMLSGMSLALDIIKGVSDAMVELIGVLGSAGPILAGGGILAFLTRGNPGWVQNLLKSTASGLGKAVGFTGSMLANPLQGFGVPVATGLPRKLAAEKMGEAFESKAIVYDKQIGAGIAVGMLAALRAAKQDFWGMGLVIASGVAGGLAGGSKWAMIGSTIASAFASRVEQVADKIGRQPIVVTQDTTVKDRGEEEVAQTLVDAIAEAKGLPKWFVEAGVTMRVAMVDASKIVTSLFGKTMVKPVKDYLAPAGVIQEEAKETQAAIVAAYQAGLSPDKIYELLSGMATAGLEDIIQMESAYTRKIREIREEGTGILLEGFDLKALAPDLKARLREEFYDVNTGMSTAAFSRRIELLTGAESSVRQITDALSLAEEGLDVFSGELENMTDLYNLLQEIILYGTDEQINSIVNHTNAIKDAYNKIQTAQDEAKKTTDQAIKEALLLEADEQKLLLSELLETLPNLILLTDEQIKLSRVKIPSVERYPDLMEEGFNKVVAMAELMNEELENALTEEEREVRKAQLETLKKLIEISPGVFKEITREAAELFGEAFNRLTEEGQLAKDLGVQQLDMSFADFTKVSNAVEKLMPTLEAMGYKPEREEILTKLDNDQWLKLKTDWKIFNILLEKILETEKQQLEGIYNLPANGTFWVPFQARQIEPDGIDTSQLEAGVDAAGNQVKTAIELAAERIAVAIENEKRAQAEDPIYRQMKADEIEKRLLEEDQVYRFSKEVPVSELATTHEQDVIGSGIATTELGRTLIDLFRLATTHEGDVQSGETEYFTGWENPPLFGEKFKPAEGVSAGIWNQLSDLIKKITTQDFENVPEFDSLMYKWLKSILVPRDFWGDSRAPEREEPASDNVWENHFINFLNALQRIFTPKQVGTTLQRQSQFIPMSGAINTAPVSNNLRDTAISQANMAIPASQQRLNLNISSNVNLRLDGRMVANVVKRYLGESLLRYSSSSGSISRSVVL